MTATESLAEYGLAIKPISESGSHPDFKSKTSRELGDREVNNQYCEAYLSIYLARIVPRQTF